MSQYEWITLIQSILMTVAAAIVWVLGRERKHLDEKIKELGERLDRGSDRYSTLASSVQSLMIEVAQLPVEMGDKFVTRDRFEDLLEDSRTYREQVREELARLNRRRT